jgi:hypothetical protein
MGRRSEPLFYEEQKFRQARLRILTAMLPVAMSLLAILQVGFGYSFGKHPMSNVSVIGWAIFLWLVYFRLMTVKLVTEVWPDAVTIALRGLWRTNRVSIDAVQSAKVVTFDPVQDWGGYGIRANRKGRAYLAAGNQGVKLELIGGRCVLIGSQRPYELAGSIRPTS